MKLAKLVKLMKLVKMSFGTPLPPKMDDFSEKIKDKGRSEFFRKFIHFGGQRRLFASIGQ